MTDETKVPERKLRHEGPHGADAAGSPLLIDRGSIGANASIDNPAWRIKRPPDRPWPFRALPVFGAGLLGRDDIRAPADLAKATWLTATMRPDDWQRWLAKARLTSLSPERWVTFDHTNLALGAAMDGLDVAIAPAYLIEGELRAGRLIAP